MVSWNRILKLKSTLERMKLRQVHGLQITLGAELKSIIRYHLVLFQCVENVYKLEPMSFSVLWVKAQYFSTIAMEQSVMH